MMSGPIRVQNPMVLKTLRANGACVVLVMLLAGCGTGPSSEVRRFNQMGLDYYHRGDYTAAITAFSASREQDRETPEPGYYIGRCYLALADKNFREDNLVTAVRYCDQAIHQFTAAYEAFPGYANALQGKAEALRRKGQQQAALELAEWAATTAGPNARLLIFQAREQAQHGDVDKALVILQQAVDMQPDSPAIHAELGRFYARFGNRPAAVASLKKALELDPRAPGVAMTLASMGESDRVPVLPD